MDLGTYVKTAREARHLTVEAVAASTKINRHLLIDLENNDFKRWPKQDVYRRGFLRAFSKALALDPEDVLQRFAREFPNDQGSSRPKPQHVAPAIPRIAVAGKVSPWQRYRRFAMPAALGLGVVIGAAAFAFQARTSFGGTPFSSTGRAAPAVADPQHAVSTPAPAALEEMVRPPETVGPPAQAVTERPSTEAQAVVPAATTVVAARPETARPETARPETARPETAKPLIAKPNKPTRPAAAKLPALATKPATAEPPATETDTDPGVTGPVEGRLTIVSNPAGAYVTVNGIGRGNTPVTVDYLPRGSHIIRIVQAGYDVAERRVTIDAARPRQTVRIDLRSRSIKQPTN